MDCLSESAPPHIAAATRAFSRFGFAPLAVMRGDLHLISARANPLELLDGNSGAAHELRHCELLRDAHDALTTVAFEVRVLTAFAATRAVTILRITRSGNGLSGVN